METDRAAKRGFYATAIVLTSVMLGCGIQLVSWKMQADENKILTEERIRAEASSYYGYFADSYMDDKEGGLSKASIGVLAKYLKLWKPGSEWDNGFKLNRRVLDFNIRKAYEIASARNEASSKAACEDEFHNPAYSVLSGLGIYREDFIEKSSVGTDPAKWNTDTMSELYDVANLVKILRESNASCKAAKAYFAYPRPYRWNIETGKVISDSVVMGEKTQYRYMEEQVIIEIAEEKELVFRDPAGDGGFPSGHTNAAYLAAYALAYAIPEQYNELLMRAAILGNNRIVAGMHSPLDVMGGRMVATAISAAALYDEINASAVQKAYDTAHKKLLAKESWEIADASDYERYQQNLAQYIAYLTYDFEQIGSTKESMRVPKGAEALLRTRFPYLNDNQIRWVLYSTGLESGYPLLDDEEGWGRLNLYAAANGYGSFDTNLIVTMDASKGGFHKADNWMNDINGAGGLIKQGTGALVLAGHNSYSGGTEVKEGILVAASETALGSGNVMVSGGILEENVKGAVIVEGDYQQREEAVLSLHIDSAEDKFVIEGTAQAGGVLLLNFENSYSPKGEVIVLEAKILNGTFDEIKINGLSEAYQAEYQNEKLVITKRADGV